MEHTTTPLTLKDVKLGKYPIRIRKEGYEDWSGEAEVKENAFAEIDATLVRSTGSLKLSSEPAGISYEVRGEKSQRGTTPASLAALPTGSYEVIFRKDNWPEVSRKVEVKRNVAEAALAEFIPGRMAITSEPSGAEVVSGGQVIGKTPLALPEVIPGPQAAEIRLKGYRPQTVRGEVKPKEELRLTGTLEKLAERRTLADLNLVLERIAAGSFSMGSATGKSDEKPVTQVTISRSYWLGKTEVTQGQWSAVMGSNPSYFKGENLPVEVSWEEAMAYCRKLTERERNGGRLPEGYEYTLPTEAQWEYACRAGTTGDYAGSLDAMGWYSSNSGSKTRPVGQKEANAWGLSDMHGNVWEWCSDWYGDYPGASVTDPTGPASGANPVGRGGSWFSTAAICRSARRSRLSPGYRLNNLGFRLALSAVR